MKIANEKTVGNRENSAREMDEFGAKKFAKKVLSEDQKEEIRELFEDVYVQNRWKIIRMNFLRGIFFGLGTFLGGTIVVALVIYILGQLHFVPFAQEIINALQKR